METSLVYKLPAHRLISYFNLLEAKLTQLSEHYRSKRKLDDATKTLYGELSTDLMEILEEWRPPDDQLPVNKKKSTESKKTQTEVIDEQADLLTDDEDQEEIISKPQFTVKLKKSNHLRPPATPLPTPNLFTIFPCYKPYCGELFNGPINLALHEYFKHGQKQKPVSRKCPKRPMFDCKQHPNQKKTKIGPAGDEVQGGRIR